MTTTTYTLEEAVPLLQQQAADRLVLFRLHQSCNQDIVNYITQRTAQLERDVEEVVSAAQARNRPQTDVITEEPDEKEAESESEGDDTESE